LQKPAAFASLFAKPAPTNWDTITYTYEPGGKRITKNVDGYPTRYVYDGGHVIAEYDDSGLLRKYIYGARVDEPVCMIDVADSNAAYYYHFDGLGSVVALSNSNGDTCQSYEYSVYGQVAASDPNFLANPYMFTGRRFDIETGLYYYRARYYNPHIGRFMQTDPVGYAYGINWYLYCGNNPLNYADPLGLSRRDPSDPCENFTYYTFEVYSLEAIYNRLGWMGYGGIDMMDFSVIVGDFEPGEKKSISIGVGKLRGTEIFTLNGVGLLDEHTLNNIIEPSVQAVNEWKRQKSRTNYGNLYAHCDTWFHYTSVNKWLYDGTNEIYDNSDINYILEGHAMAHMRMTYEEGKEWVFRWKRFINIERYTEDELKDTLFWFEKGYKEYGDRDDW